MIIITRADPALRLSRLRANGGLVEVRARDLSFTLAEAREVLVSHAGLELDDDDLEVLLHRTEGWPAALYLAALWLRNVEDPHQAVGEFGGDHGYVAEYLSHEVLAALHPDEREFLMRAAVLGSFTAELCDGVFARADSAATLAELERSNMFVTSLERRAWFRVHPLFAQFATAQLASSNPGAVDELHTAAARWLRARGLIVEATRHASAAGDHELVAELMTEYHLALIRNGRAGTLLRWVQTLPDECVVAHPELAAAAATAATIVGGRALERRRLLKLVERTKAEHPERFGRYAECVTAMVRAAGIDEGVSHAVTQGRRAVELARDGGDETLVASLASLARALYFAGDLNGAWSAAASAVSHPDAERRSPGYALAESTLAVVAAELGRLRSARRHAEKARAIIGRITSSRSWLGATVALAMGAVLDAEGDLAAAERDYAHAERFFRDEVATVHHARLLVSLARVQCRRGRLDEAEATVREAGEEIAELGDSGTTPSRAAAVAQELEQARRHAAGELLEMPSDAELAVLRLLATDLSARQIGEQLFLSPNTVKSHVQAIYRKLGVSARADAVARADALGLPAERNHPGERRQDGLRSA
jgi:LuxR family maltose regulon positive regulatory protein